MFTLILGNVAWNNSFSNAVLRRRRVFIGIMVCLELVIAAPVHGEVAHELKTIQPRRGWISSANELGACSVWTSKVMRSRVRWDELVPSWNVAPELTPWLKFEVRVFAGGNPSPWYHLGQWSLRTNQFPRFSQRNQSDPFAAVQTDTLILKTNANRFQVRLTAGTPTEGQSARPGVNFLSLSLLNSKVEAAADSGRSMAWGREIPMTGVSQLLFAGGQVWCSPTSVAMMMAHWAKALDRPELAAPVPQVAADVFDPHWPGTGNWAFNMAYAGSFDGIRSYVTRCRSLNEVEEWTNRGIPVALSVCNNRLRGIENRPSGHLVVCVGFTQQGEVILLNPAFRHDVRQVVSRQRLLHAWDHSKRTIYVVKPSPSSW